MSRRRRYLILFLIPVALLGICAAVVLSLPAERVAALAASRAGEALGREVQFGGVGVHLLPRPAVELRDVRVAGAPGDSTPLLQMDRVALRPRILPLLRRQVLVDAVILDRPVLRVAVDSSGVSNLPELSGGDTSPTGSGRAAAFAVRRLDIHDGSMEYTDARKGTVRLDGVQQRLSVSGELRGGQLGSVETDGELDVAALSASLPGVLAVPIEGVRVRLEHLGTLDRRADVLQIERLKLRVQDIELEGSGRIDHMADSLARTVDFRLETGRFDIGRLLASLPATLRERAEEAGHALDAGGEARISARVQGAAGSGRRPDIAGMLTLSGASLALRPGGEVVSGLRGDIAFSLDSLSSERLTGSLTGRPMALAFRVSDPAAPQGRMAFRGALDLARLDALGLLPDSVDAKGTVALDVRAAGSVMHPSGAAVDGQATPSDVVVRTPSSGQPARLASGRLVLAGRDLRGEALRATLGSSDVTADFRLRDWLAFALHDSTKLPALDFDARSKRLDLDALRPDPSPYRYSQLFWARMRGTKVNGMTAEQAADSAGLGLPDLPRIALNGRLRAATLRNGGTDFQDVDLSVGGRAGQLEVRAGSFRMLGGGVQLAGELGSPATPGAAHPLRLKFQVRDVGIEPFLQRFTAFRDNLTGGMLLVGDARLAVDDHLLPERESVAGDGQITLSDGRLVGWPVLRALAQRLGAQGLDTLAFKQWDGSLRFAGPRLLLRDSRLRAGDADIELAGWFDVNGSLDIGGTIMAPGEWAARLPGNAGRLAAAGARPDGRIPIGVAITGTAAKPGLKLDFSEAAGQAARAARQRAEEEARAQAQKAVQRAAEKVVGPLPPVADSASAIVDTARQKLQRAVGDKLRSLLPTKKSPADSTRPDSARPDTTGGGA